MRILSARRLVEGTEALLIHRKGSVGARPRGSVQFGERTMARPRLCGLWLGVSAGGRSWSLLASSIVLRRALSAPARSVRVSHASDPASGHEPRPKPLPNPSPNPNPRLTRFVTSEGLNPSPLAGRRGRSNEKHPTAQPTLSNPTASALFSTWPPNPNQTAPPLRIYAAHPGPHPDQPIPLPRCSFPLALRPLHQSRLPTWARLTGIRWVAVP